MLSKLIKHEFRATSRVMLPLYAAMICAAIVARISTWYLEGISKHSVFTGLSVLGIAIFVFSIVAVTVMAIVVVVNRFVKNLMADEGYIMFTLPVTTHQIIFSKIVVALVWYIGTAIADAIAVIVAWANTEFVNETIEFLSKLLMGFTKLTTEEKLNLTGYGIESIVGLILAMVVVTLIFYYAISIGHSFSNHKTLISVVIFIGTTFVLEILGVIGLVSLAEWDYLWQDMTWTNLDSYGIIHAILIGGIIVETICGTVFYFITHRMLKNHLNLG